MTFLEQILLTIVTASVTAILAYFGFWRQAKAELQKEYESRYNEKKWSVYLNFLQLTKNHIDIAAEIFVDEMYDKSKAYYESFDPIRAIESELLLISSKHVISCYIKWKDCILHAQYDLSTEDVFYFHLIQAMREDLGKEKYIIGDEEFLRLIM